MAEPVVLDGRSLTPALVAHLSLPGGQIRPSPEAVEKNAQAHRATLRLLERNASVYGLTTGVGALKEVPVQPQGEEAQRRLWRSHAGGAGAPLPRELVRALVAVRLNQLLAGGAGVHPSLIEALVFAYNHDRLPPLRRLGAVGTGDLGALSELGLSLLGERHGLADGAPKLFLGPRDGLMLMSSNALTVAEAAVGAARLNALTWAGEAVAALSFEAAGASLAPLDERVHPARAHPGQVASAARLRALLSGFAPRSARLQDSFGFRCAPQVFGALRQAISSLEDAAQVELNAAAENALVVGDEAIPNGNFHAALLAQALDTSRASLAQVAELCLSRLSELFDAKATGLNAFLARTPGPDSGLMILEYTAADAAAEIRHLAAPVGHAANISHGVENHASFANLAARSLSRALELVEVVFACELCAAVRALRMRGGSPAGRGIRALYEAVREALPAEVEDRPLGDHLETARALLYRPPFHA